MSEPCLHPYPLIDEHEGTTVCCECGLVLEEVFYEYSKIKQDPEVTTKKTFDNPHLHNDAMEILSRLNMPDYFVNDLKNEEKKVGNLYDVINRNSVITTKEFCAVSGIQNKKLVKLNQNKIIETNIELLLEKYCKLLDLTYKDYTLIKALLDKKPPSGHPPLTIIGYYIFVYCKTHKKKIFMKNICSVLNISAISIQRYRKHAISCGN
jgi:transcription initiation factor TFIIIB Brf1 subunit/transcription initiation factor TFIIB